MIYGRYFGLPRASIRERADELLHFFQLADRAATRSTAVGWNEAPLGGGARPHQRSRAAPARRTHNQASTRKRGIAVGAAVPTQASGVTIVLTSH